MTKKWLWLLLVLPIAVVVGAIAPGTDGWRAPCACISAKDSFAHWAKTRSGDLWDPQASASVAKGIQQEFPQGTAINELKERVERMFSQAGSCQKRDGGYACQFWLETKGNEERGYEVAFGVSPDGTATTGVTSARIIHATNRRKS